MLMDIQNQFSNAQAITATAVSTNYVDLGAICNIGTGECLYLVLHITTAFTDASSDSTLTPSMEADNNTSFSSPATIRTFDVFAALTAVNTIRKYRLEPFTDSGLFERYLQLRYTVANGNFTTAAISSFLVEDVQAWKAYAVGYTIQ